MHWYVLCDGTANFFNLVKDESEMIVENHCTHFPT